MISTQKLPTVCSSARKTADERDRQHDAGRRRQKVLMRQAEHLHEVRQRAFAAVVLPVGVGDEADRRVEGEIGRDRRLLGRIERQARLQAHQRIENRKAADVEEQHGDRVGQPVLFAFLIDTRGAVERQFDRPQDRREKSALAIEDARHVGAEHRRERDDDRAIKKDLNPADHGHDTDLSKPLWPQQSVDEVDQQSRGHEGGERIVEDHGCLLRADRRRRRSRSTGRKGRGRAKGE